MYLSSGSVMDGLVFGPWQAGGWTDGWENEAPVGRD